MQSDYTFLACLCKVNESQCNRDKRSLRDSNFFFFGGGAGGEGAVQIICDTIREGGILFKTKCQMDFLLF